MIGGSAIARSSALGVAPDSPATLPLFVRDEALRDRVAPHLGRAAFIRLVGELEADGFPRVDPLFRGRYWPAVVAFLDRRAGLRDAGPLVVDGAETWGADSRQDVAGAHPRARFKTPK